MFQSCQCAFSEFWGVWGSYLAKKWSKMVIFQKIKFKFAPNRHFFEKNMNLDFSMVSNIIKYHEKHSNSPKIAIHTIFGFQQFWPDFTPQAELGIRQNLVYTETVYYAQYILYLGHLVHYGRIGRIFTAKRYILYRSPRCFGMSSKIHRIATQIFPKPLKT